MTFDIFQTTCRAPCVFKMADEKANSIPIVDFSVLSLENSEVPCDSDQRVRQVASEICKAFSDVGFVYLKNYGIADDEVSRIIAPWPQKVYFIHTYLEYT